jgi:nucleotide-binding universal stress UspA family protein
MTEIRQILCPIDFSDTARHALEHAVVIAKWYGSRVSGLCVVHPPVFPPPPMLLSASASTTAGPDREALRHQLLEWLEQVGQAKVATEALLEDGNVAAAILDQAERVRADLIVMGTHGLSGFERFMLGSVTERVLRKARTPVLTVPPSATTTHDCRTSGCCAPWIFRMPPSRPFALPCRSPRKPTPG